MSTIVTSFSDIRWYTLREIGLVLMVLITRVPQ